MWSRIKAFFGLDGQGNDVWATLWDAGAEWLALPAGQHRSGTSVRDIFDRIDDEAKQAWRDAVRARRRLAVWECEPV